MLLKVIEIQQNEKKQHHFLFLSLLFDVFFVFLEIVDISMNVYNNKLRVERKNTIEIFLIFVAIMT
jgi:hypothetical protein